MWHKILIVGNLGKDPEMRPLQNGSSVTSFSIATTERWNSKDGEPQERTVWWRVSVFGKQAESSNRFLKKGSRALVEGRMNPDASGTPKIWTRSDGTPGASYDVTADVVKFLSPADSQDKDSHAQGQDEEEIPF